jgi:hypothetical protein
MDLKALIADQMGYFTPPDIATALVSLLAAAFFGFIAAMVTGAGTDPGKREMAVTAALVAFAVHMVRASVPLSIALVAVVLLLRGEVRSSSTRSLQLRLFAMAIGVGCGSSASIMVAALVLPLGLLLRWATVEKN